VRRRVHLLWSETVQRDRRRRRLVMAARLAAALVISAGAVLWLSQRGQPTGVQAAVVERVDGPVRLQNGSLAETGRALPAGARVITAPDGRAALRLADGASIRLDRATELLLVSPRLLELRRGAVYVDSGGPPAGGPRLEIGTAFGRVRDVGTQFEVRLAGEQLRVSVREGSAILARDDRTYPVPRGTLLRVDRSGAAETAAIGPDGAEWDWALAVAPAFELEGRPLRDYLAWLSRETGWQVEYDDPSIATAVADIVLHGSTAGLRPDQTPDAVLPACGLGYRLDGATLRIARAGGPGPVRDPGDRR
jgi:ferric-dicitrate binding protein FerR (iron transport regulator)